MKRPQIPKKLAYKVAVVKKFNLHEIAAVNLSDIFFLKNAKNTISSFLIDNLFGEDVKCISFVCAVFSPEN